MRTILITFLFFLSHCGTEEIKLRPTNHDDSETPTSQENDSTSTFADTSLIPAGFVSVYSTSFENVQKKNRHSLNWDFPHWVEYAAMHKEDGGEGNGLGGGDIWVEDSITLSGKKSIGLQLTDIEKSRRTEFTIYPEDYIQDEYFISYWLYLAEDWGLYDPTIEWDWFEIGNPFNTFGRPYAAIHISEPDANQENFAITLSLREENGTLSSLSEKRLKLPKGRWFNISYYVYRHEEKGAIKLWFDDHYIGGKIGIPTKSTKTDNFAVSIAKIYHERGDKVPHQLWIDDLELFAPAGQ